MAKGKTGGMRPAGIPATLQLERLEPRLLLSAPDLTVSMVSGMGTVVPGDAVEFSWRVSNWGDQSATGSWSDSLYLSSDTSLDGSDELLGSHSAAAHSPLAASATYDESLEVTIPGDATPGSQYVLFVTDSGGEVAETNESNNVFAKATEVTDADLVVTSVSAPESAEVNETISVSYTVKNQGSTSAMEDWWDMLYLSADTVLDCETDWWMGDEDASPYLPLAAGASYTVEASLEVPPIGEGTFYLLASADDFDWQAETDETNNVGYTEIALTLPDVDLVLQSTNAPATAPSNATIAVSWSVQNQGSETAQASRLYDYVYLSEDATLDDSDTELLWEDLSTHSPLAPGGTYDVSTTVDLPNVPAGDYYLIVSVNGGISDRMQGEVDYTNNLQALSIAVTASGIDLQVTDISGPSAAEAGASVDVSWTVQNYGSDPADANWVDKVYFSDDTALDGGDTLLGSYDASADSPLAGGASYDGSAAVSIPDVTPGSYYLLVVTDAEDAQAEDVDGNNVASTPLTVAGADLTVASLSTVTQAMMGDSISVSWTVMNQGAGAASGSWSDAVYLSNDETLDGGDALLGTFSAADQSPLAFAEHYSFTREVTLPTDSSGTFYLLCVTDANGELGETNESNNVAASEIEIAPMPNLTVISIDVPESAPSGARVTVQWTVKNLGGPVASSWYDAIYVSTDAVLDDGDTNVGLAYHSLETLETGGQYTQSRQIYLPAMAEGECYVIVAADVGDRSMESDETDNVRAQALSITVPELTPGVPLAGQITSDVQMYCYRIELDSEQNILFTMDSEESGYAWNKLYVRRGAPPTVQDYDYESDGWVNDPRFIVPNAAAGTWYVGVGSLAEPAHPDYTIEADVFTLVLFDSTPDELASGNPFTLHIEGGVFDRETSVALVGEGATEYAAEELWVESFDQVEADFGSDVPAGVYTIRVSDGSGSTAELADALTLTEGSPAYLEGTLSVPSRVGYHIYSRLDVSVANTGECAMDAPLVFLTAKQSDEEGAWLTMDNSKRYYGLWAADAPEGYSHNAEFRVTVTMPSSSAAVARQGYCSATRP